MIWTSIWRYDIISESEGLISSIILPVKYYNNSYPYDVDELAGHCPHYKPFMQIIGAGIQSGHETLDNPPSKHTNYDYRIGGGQAEKSV